MASYTKRKDGRYQARIYLGLNENRKKIFKYIYADNEKQLKKLESEMRNKMAHGVDIADTNDTYTQWLTRLERVKETELTESEYNTFTARASYFCNYFGDVPLPQISQQLIQPAINEIYKFNPATGKPSAKRTVERYLAAASAVFECAIENRAADFNPCRYVKIPKDAKTNERRALSSEERKRIDDTPHRAQLAAMLLMYSGLRRGEATALLWSDIDFGNKTISVTKSYDFKSGQIKAPKTAAGFRTVSIPDKLVDFLCKAERKSIYVLTTTDGRMLTETAWKRLFESYICDLNIKYGKSISRKSKYNPGGNILTIEPFTPHCLRHTFCTIMYEAGIDVLTAKEQMGHSDIKTTLAIYTHLDKLHKQKNMTKMNNYLQNNA